MHPRKYDLKHDALILAEFSSYQSTILLSYNQYKYSYSLVSRARPLFSVYVVVEKRVWSNGQGGLVSYTPRFSGRANHSDHHFL